MDYNKIASQAERLHRNAKSGNLIVKGAEYKIDFDYYLGVYIVTDKDKEEVARFNTRKLAEAKKWLKEWLI